MSVRRAVLGALGVLVGLTLGFVPLQASSAMAVIAGSTCSASDIVPGNPNAPTTVPATFQFMNGDSTSLGEAVNNDRTSTQELPRICGVEAIPASQGSLRLIDDYPVPATDIGLILAKTASGSFNVTYYVTDPAGNVSAGIITVDIIHVVMPKVKRLQHGKFAFKVHNTTGVTLLFNFAPDLTKSAHFRKIIIAPHKSRKLHGYSRVVQYEVSALDNQPRELFLGYGKVVFPRHH